MSGASQIKIEKEIKVIGRAQHNKFQIVQEVVIPVCHSAC